MYCYEMVGKKRKEAFLAISLLILSVLFFAFAEFPAGLLPQLFRLVGFLHLTAFLGVLLFCFLQSYLYCIEAGESAYTEAPDFVILQRRGRQTRTVCRISVLDVQAVQRVTPENRKALHTEIKGRRVYHYCDRIRPDNLYLLTVTEGEDVCYIRIMADERLLSYFEGR